MYKYSFNYNKDFILREKDGIVECVSSFNLTWQNISFYLFDGYVLFMDKLVSEEEALNQAIKLGMNKVDFYK